jgi:hypothetical protein
MREIVVLSLLLLSGCGRYPPSQYAAHDACLGIGIGTPMSSLPMGGPATKYTSVSHMIPSKGEHTTLRCCQLCGWGQQSCACGVDCADPALRATPLQLPSPYSGTCSDHGTGSGTCNVWSRDGQVVGVWFVCHG